MQVFKSGGGVALVIAAVAVVGVGGSGGGCSNRQDQAVRVLPESGPVDLAEAPVLTAPGRGGRGIEAGLEVGWMVATADHQTVATALLPYVDQPLPCRRQVVDMWAVNGLRIVRVPLSDWPSLSEKLRLAGASQRQWINQTSGWIEIIRGPERPRGQTIALDAERLDLGPGRLRLLARCWPAPVEPVADAVGVGAKLTIELLPQHVEAHPRTLKQFSMTEAPSEPADKLDAGLVFSRLSLEMSARGVPGASASGSDSDSGAEVGGGFAYLVIPERPGVNWNDYVVGRPESSEAATDEGVSRSRDASVPRVGEVIRHGRASAEATPGSGSASSGAGIPDAGPEIPSVPTLGEALFGVERGRVFADGRSDQAKDAAGRALVVLVPRVPATFRLLPPVTASTP